MPVFLPHKHSKHFYEVATISAMFRQKHHINDFATDYSRLATCYTDVMYYTKTSKSGLLNTYDMADTVDTNCQLVVFRNIYYLLFHWLHI